MSKRSARRSTILPLPSSPHWAPITTIVFAMLLRGRGFRDTPIDDLRDYVFGSCSDYSFFFFAPAKKNHGRNAFDSVLSGNLRIVVDIEFYDGSAAGVLLGDCHQRGRESSTRSAPFGPEVDEHWGARFQHVFCKRAVANFIHMITHQKSLLVI